DDSPGGISRDASSVGRGHGPRRFAQIRCATVNRPVRNWRLAAFAAGLVAVWLAVFSPIAHFDHHLLTAHMAPHLLLMVVAVPLILLGARSILVRWRPHPAFCWLAGSLTVLVWHVPAVFELALRSHFWHGFEQASFFLAGIVFWWPVIRPEPSPCWFV